MQGVKHSILLDNKKSVPNKKSMPNKNQKRHLMTAYHHLSQWANGMLKTCSSDQERAETKFYISRLLSKRYEADRRSQNDMSFARKLANVVEVTGEFILLMPEILSESQLKKISEANLHDMLKALQHLLPKGFNEFLTADNVMTDKQIEILFESSMQSSYTCCCSSGEDDVLMQVGKAAYLALDMDAQQMQISSFLEYLPFPFQFFLYSIKIN